MKRALVIGVVVVAAIAGASIWYLTRAPRTPASDAAAQTDAWLALRIDAYSAGPAEPLVIVARAYDRRARQSAIVRDATGGRWRGSGAATSRAERAPEAGWPGRMTLLTDAGQEIPFTVAEPAGAPVPDRAVLVVAAGAGGATSLTAVLAYDAGEARSNAASVGPAPGRAEDRLRAIGRQAEVLADASRLIATGAELAAIDGASPWGHYFSGAGHEIRGEKAEAVAAFERALARVTAGYEPPIGLVARINRLRR